ncbi:MAG: hypothetical protein EOO73_20070 [Myxococcales bacterium]|nr:MAG: hypothetical protein EOO73_20070 [Myxococcales bacterium]
MVDSTASPELERWFGQAQRKVRGRLWARRVLTGMAVGLCAGSLAAAALWWQRQSALRPLAGVLGLVGAGAGAVVAARRRWSDEHVALYLDEKLSSQERIVTALGLRREPSEAARHLSASAAAVLRDGLPGLRGPRVLDAAHWLAPLGAGAIVWLSLAPLPPAPVVTTPPGVERIQARSVKGLERIEALRAQKGRSPEDERRLRALADEAKKLRSELSQGMEKREALSRMAKLRDAIAELRSELGNSQNRQGLEAALGALNEHPELRKAARALGDGDITGFDREMQRLANLAEQESRETAKQALEEAERAAREKGAPGLADALKQQREAFAKQGADAEALRELAKALEGQLDPEALEDLKEFGQSGDPKAGQRLAEAMGKALSKLSPEERKRLAEQLKKQIAHNQKQGGAATPMTPEEMEELARRLASAEGQKELEEQLRQLANPDKSPEAQRDGALDDAERGLGEAERGLGMMPMPAPGSGAPKGGPGQSGAGEDGNGGPGSQHDAGQGKHDGQSEKVDAPELRSKANVPRSGAGPMHAATLGRAPARPGDTANQRGTGALGSAAPGEIGAVEQSEVPEEYREHVGRYFEP